MQLIADSGGSGTTWILINGGDLTYIEGGGLHPDVITNKTELPHELTQYANQVKYVRFYGSGCATEEKAEKVKQFLKGEFNNAVVYVYSDLLALAHPVFGARKGLVAILGTGSSMSYYDGKTLYFKVNSPGQGIDPGSGPVIGGELIKQYDEGKLSQEAMTLLEKGLKTTTDNKIRIHKVNEILFENLHIPDFHSICRQSFISFFDFYEPLWIRYNYPIVFGGSIAALGHNVLVEVIQEYGLQLANVIRYPIKELAFHYSESESD